MTTAERSEKLLRTIKNKAQEFCLDNPRLLGAETVIESAMMIGANIGMEFNGDLEVEAEIDPAIFQCPCGEHH